MPEPIKVEMRPLSDLVALRWSGNPKEHALSDIGASMGRFGYVAPILVGPEGLLAGHGRVDTLIMKKEKGEPPPRRCELRDDGEWLIPVITGYDDLVEKEGKAYVLADNRMTELGGYDMERLSQAFDLLADNLDGLGWSPEQIASIKDMQAAPTLDDLADEYGEPKDEDFWPVIKIKVCQEAKELYDSLMADAAGGNESEKFYTMLRCVNAALLGTELP